MIRITPTFLILALAACTATPDVQPNQPTTHTGTPVNPATLDTVIQSQTHGAAAAKIQTQSTSNANTIAQYAAVAALFSRHTKV